MNSIFEDLVLKGIVQMAYDSLSLERLVSDYAQVSFGGNAAANCDIRLALTLFLTTPLLGIRISKRRTASYSLTTLQQTEACPHSWT